MEVLINELSLDGQFKDENEFLDGFDEILKLIKFLDRLEFILLKEYSFFQSKVTLESKLDDFLRLRTDRARKMKQFLLKLAYNPPYWNDTKKHNCSNNSYTYNLDSICNTSLAESCERDNIVLSFKHNNFLKSNLSIEKNNEHIDIYNFIDKHQFLEYLLSVSKIKPMIYCKFKFENTNLNFSSLPEVDGFSLLETSQQIGEFIDAFNQFSKMGWKDIMSSDGLQYKKYNGIEFGDKVVYKFRVTQKYRCFGYREKDEFFILKFEIDHKMSNNG
ncbi:MAG: Unknown protein [uncultured Sulfurovum sp.]|uniref:Uncharacterized protein n=1 Tax=uncultured Sulfurovum sp. TaxID=269237 RepID=A0A6S6SI78_9BACT|nr:MAG: Unknown protein [uncultured Sulfurovum sp.]